MQNAARNKAKMRRIGRRLIAKARNIHELRTAIFTPADDLVTTGSRNTKYIAGKKSLFLSTFYHIPKVHEMLEA